MSEQIFTFGFGHRCECGMSLASRFTAIPIADFHEARAKMVAVWGVKWASQYESREAAGVEQFELVEVRSNDTEPSLCRCGCTFHGHQKLLTVILESPYAGDVARNERYARACMRDCFRRNEAPYASHLLYTQPGVLDDTDKEERALGIEAGLLWARGARKAVIYADLGITPGMAKGIARHENEGRGIEYRTLPGWEG